MYIHFSKEERLYLNRKGGNVSIWLLVMIRTSSMPSNPLKAFLCSSSFLILFRILIFLTVRFLNACPRTLRSLFLLRSRVSYTLPSELKKGTERYPKFKQSISPLWHIHSTTAQPWVSSSSSKNRTTRKIIPKWCFSFLGNIEPGNILSLFLYQLS